MRSRSRTKASTSDSFSDTVTEEYSYHLYCCKFLDSAAIVKRSRLLLLAGLICLGFLLALGFGYWQRSPQSSRPDPLPQDPFIQVYFNQNLAKGADYTEPYRQIERPGDNLEQIIVDRINSAKSTVELAVQELRLPKIARTLAERHKAGVKVRVILENTYSRGWGSLSAAEVKALDERERDRYAEFVALADRNQDGRLSREEIEESDAIAILKKAGVPLLDDTADGSKGTGLMHHKFAIIDRFTLVTGSANFTTSGVHGDFASSESRGNANNLLVIQNANLAQLFAAEFELMWGDGPGGKPDSRFGLKKPLRPAQRLKIGNSTVTLQFSPISPSQPWTLSSNGLIGKILNTAQQSVQLALFVFSEQPLADILDSRHQQGVEVSALIDPSFAFRNYSEGLDLLGVALSNKCKYEADNRPWKQPIATVGVPQLPQGDKLHHKFGVVDGKTIITGSHNWSAAANHNNDETVLIIENPTVTAHFEREFERLYRDAVLGVPAKVQQKIAQQKQDCPTIVNAPSKKGLPSGHRINVNTASPAELEKLPGVGPKLAGKIVVARQQKPFTSPQDLERVPGIGPKLRQKLAGRVEF